MIFKLCASAILAATVGMLFSDIGFKGRRAFLASCGVFIVVGVLGGLREILSGVLGIAEMGGVIDIARSGARIVGAGYVFGISSDVCRELDAVGVANALSAAGKVEILLIVFPYFLKTVSLGMELLK